jgi:glycosyltransferase involved in cell wall biosynthesis
LDEYLVPTGYGEDEFVEKKSRFIGRLWLVETEEEALAKIQEMNIHTDVVFANQADRVDYAECPFEGHIAKMITTNTRGVGKNRNTALLYASADYCLLADDDVVYRDDMESAVVSAFEAYPDADVIIFHFDCDDPDRAQPKSKTFKKISRLSSLPWGGINIAFRLSAVRKANVWFTTLFGGGCIFPSGEDSMWLTEARRKGLTFYVSKETIGKIDMNDSSWFTGYDSKFYFAKGAFYEATHPMTFGIWALYFLLRMDVVLFQIIIDILSGRVGPVQEQKSACLEQVIAFLVIAFFQILQIIRG